MTAPAVNSINVNESASGSGGAHCDLASLLKEETNQASRNVFKKVSNLFRSTSNVSPTTESGYVEFGQLDNSENQVSAMNCLRNEHGHLQKRTLGSFNGVFSPVTLSMFSALIFIRVGYIVGNAGLLITIVQFLIAYAILIFTVMSVCAVSTNGAIEGGGAYFMISRTLGPEFGGSIGTLFFFANVVSSALCISGCAESLVENFGPSGYLIPAILADSFWYRLLYCTILNTLSLCLCLIGATTFARTSVMILTIVVVCICSVIISFFFKGTMEIPVPSANNLIQNATYPVNVTYTGLNGTTFTDNLYTAYGKDYTSLTAEQVTFATVFGVLFSGVTGIMAGANMSGELKNPGKSIPRGTLSAVFFTFCCYIILSVLTAFTCSRKLLQNNYMYMMPINLWPPFVAIGVLTATFSAALSNLIGGSRVLEALAKDCVFGRFLHFVTLGTWRGNPVVAVFLSWLLVQLMLLIGSLNVIAQINSVLFLLSYLATNLACMGLQLASAPNFRPSFKVFNVYTAAAGLIGSIAMMYVINAAYASFSIVACVALVIFLHLFSPQQSDQQYWGSISQALIFHQVRKYLLLLDSRKDHVKYWRPQILLLVSSPRSACPLIDFINDIKKGGLYVIGHVMTTELSGNDEIEFEPKNLVSGSSKKHPNLDCNPDPTIKQYPHWLELIDFLKVKAFVELTVAPTVREGFQHLVRISGMGAMKPNTIVLGFFDNQKGTDFFSSDSPFRTTIFDMSTDGTNLNIFPVKNKKGLEVLEYVSMITDSLRMGKNVCLCRHFQKLDKSAIASNPSFKYIDVWTIDVLNPTSSTNLLSFDTTSLFMMQLAVICRMVGIWRKLKLRVFVATENKQAVNTKLEELLKMFRIGATIHNIPNWSTVKNYAENDFSNISNNLNYDTDEDQEKYTNKNLYITNLNDIILDQSVNTAVTFIYLPKPPSYQDTYFDGEQFKQINAEISVTETNYIQILTELTENLPPTMLVHGLNAVTSTTL